jgi:uncharacterized protein
MLSELYFNIAHNMFKPLLLFFYAGFAIPLLRVKFEFPKVLYQSITIYLLLSIGWHGGEELAGLTPSMLGQAFGFMIIGFVTNTVIGMTAYGALRYFTSLRKIDAATVSGYYGSDSAGTFLTCVGVLTAAQIAYAPYMPVLLAVMEIPGCLVALYLVSRMRNAGMDSEGNSVGEPGYLSASEIARLRKVADDSHDDIATYESQSTEDDEDLVTVAADSNGEERKTSYSGTNGHSTGRPRPPQSPRRSGYRHPEEPDGRLSKDEEEEAELALQSTDDAQDRPIKSHSAFSAEMLHEVFFNPGIFLLFAGIGIGFISRLQGERVIAAGDQLFVNLFQGVLCLFLLEMGLTAAKKLKDLRTAGWQFVAFGLIAPNIFATAGMLTAHCYSLFLGQPFDVGTYVTFGVLCGSASYIALPAVQRMAIPEASPTLPLAASLGLTFSYNVTIGIPLYICIAKIIVSGIPVYA